MEKKQKLLAVTVLCCLAALAFGITSIFLDDWSTFKLENGVLTIGPLEICLTMEAVDSESVNCTSIDDLSDPEKTFLDEFQALLFTGVGGSFAGLTVSIIALACKNHNAANFGVGISVIADIIHGVGLSIFSTEGCDNYGMVIKEISKTNGTPFYLSIVGLLLNVGAGAIGKYAINHQK